MHAAGSSRRRGTFHSDEVWQTQLCVPEQQASNRQQTNKRVAACATGNVDQRLAQAPAGSGGPALDRRFNHL